MQKNRDFVFGTNLAKARAVVASRGYNHNYNRVWVCFGHKQNSFTFLKEAVFIQPLFLASIR
jgi:hypothetical protein